MALKALSLGGYPGQGDQAANSPATAALLRGGTGATQSCTGGPGTEKPCPLTISARDLCLVNEDTKESLRLLANAQQEARGFLVQLATELRVLRGDTDNALSEARLARTEACTGLAHAREVRSVVDTHEASLRNLASEVQHAREHWAEGLRRSSAELQARRSHGANEIAELRGLLASLEMEVRELTCRRGPGAHQQVAEAWADSDRASQKRLGELRKEVQELADQQRSLSLHWAEATEGLKADMHECKSRLDQAQRKRAADEWAREAAALVEAAAPQLIPTRPSAPRIFERPSPTSKALHVSSACSNPGGMDEIPRAWKSLLEDVVRRAQWVCEATRTELTQLVEDRTSTLATQFAESEAVSAQSSAIACDSAASASQEAKEALETLRLVTERAKEGEEATGRRIARLEQELRNELKAAKSAAGVASEGLAHLKEEEAALQRRVDSLDEAIKSFSRELHNVAETLPSDFSAVLNRLTKAEQALLSVDSLKEVPGKLAADLSAEKVRASKALDDLREEVRNAKVADEAKAVRLFVDLREEVDRRLRETKAQVEDSFRQERHSDGEAAAVRRDLEVKLQGLLSSFNELKAQVSNMVPADRGPSAPELLSQAKFLAEERCQRLEAALSRVRQDCLQAQTLLADRMTQDVSGISAKLEAFALDEVQKRMAEKTSELYSFALQLRDAALEEVRIGLDALQSKEGSTPGAQEIRGSGAGAARALRR